MLGKNERYVIRKGGSFLRGIPYEDSNFCRWGWSPYDGFQSESFDAAIIVAKRLGAEVMVFDRLTGDISGGWK